MLKTEDPAIDKTGALGTIVKAQLFTQRGRQELKNPDKVLFLSRKEWQHLPDEECHSPFGDVGYELEIVWADGLREFWVLTHPEPTAIGLISKKQDDTIQGVKISYDDLHHKMSVLVA